MDATAPSGRRGSGGFGGATTLFAEPVLAAGSAPGIGFEDDRSEAFEGVVAGRFAAAFAAGFADSLAEDVGGALAVVFAGDFAVDLADDWAVALPAPFGADFFTGVVPGLAVAPVDRDFFAAVALAAAGRREESAFAPADPVRADGREEVEEADGAFAARRVGMGGEFPAKRPWTNRNSAHAGRAHVVVATRTPSPMKLQDEAAV